MFSSISTLTHDPENPTWVLPSHSAHPNPGGSGGDVWALSGHCFSSKPLPIFLNSLEVGDGLLVTALDMTTSFQTGGRWVPSINCWNHLPDTRYEFIFPLNSS